jgi:hypothetical protein
MPLESNTPLTWKVSELLDLVTGRHPHKKINLNPVYQRDEVWAQPRQSQFIQDVLIDNLPTQNLIFREMWVEGKTMYNCIDGKQRCTSICSFLLDTIKVCYHNEGNPKKFTELPYELKCDVKNRLLHVSVVVCDDATEKRIFQNVNKGMSLSGGEKALSYTDSPINRAREEYFGEEAQFRTTLESYIGALPKDNKRHAGIMTMNAIIAGLGMGPDYITTAFDAASYEMSQATWDNLYRGKCDTNKIILQNILENISQRIRIPKGNHRITGKLWSPGKIMGTMIYVIHQVPQVSQKHIQDVFYIFIKRFIEDKTVFDTWYRLVYAGAYTITTSKLKKGWDLLCTFKDTGSFTHTGLLDNENDELDLDDDTGSDSDNDNDE